MEICRITIDELLTDDNFKKVVNETLDDRLIYKEGVEIIKRSHLFALKTKGTIIGFYSLDNLGGCVEIHFYIYAPFRKYSLSALRCVMALQEGDIKTSVYGTHFHVVQFLLKKGFRITGTLNNALVKDGETFNVYELYYTKELTNKPEKVEVYSG